MCVLLTLLLLPAASVNVTLASIVLSASAVKSHRYAYCPRACCAIYSCSIRLAIDHNSDHCICCICRNIFNTPVTVTLPDASDALITLSDVTESTVKLTPSVFGPTASTIAVPVMMGYLLDR